VTRGTKFPLEPMLDDDHSFDLGAGVQEDVVDRHPLSVFVDLIARLRAGAERHEEEPAQMLASSAREERLRCATTTAAEADPRPVPEEGGADLGNRLGRAVELGVENGAEDAELVDGERNDRRIGNALVFGRSSERVRSHPRLLIRYQCRTSGWRPALVAYTDSGSW
jgi:hypothetical protein